MNTKLLVPVAALVAALGITASTAGASSGTTDDLVLFDPRTDVVETMVDVNDEGFSAGDTILEQASLVWPDSGEPAGRAITRVQVVESRVAPSDDDPIGDFLFVLDCTFELDAGTITFHGTAERVGLLDSGVMFPVSGGTGDYAGVGGTVHITLTEVDGQPGVGFDFDIADA